MRNMPHLTSLRGRAGALVTPTGRIMAASRTAMLAGAGRGRPRAATGSRSTTGARWRSSRSPRATCCTRRGRDGRARHRSALSLRFLGDAAPRCCSTARSVPLTLRPAELLTALALHPDGLTAERLALLLYGDDGNPTTVRGEVLRLRGLIGADVLRTRPYRLDAVVDTDFGAIRRALRSGQAAEALRACAGPLLPRSDAPEIRELRDELAAGLRRAVLDSDDVELLADVRHAPPGRGRPGDARPAGRGAAPARPPPPRLRGPAHPAAGRVNRTPPAGGVRRPAVYSTVTLLARLRGLSTSRPSATAAW